MADPVCGSGMGSGGTGGMPFGTGTDLGILSALATATNAVDVTFVGIPQTQDSASIFDALNPNNWSLSAIVPFDAQLRLVQTVELVNETTVRVLFDGDLQPDAIYAISVDNVRSAFGLPLDDDCTQAEFFAFGTTFLPFDQELNNEQRTDVANPSVPQDTAQNGSLGTFQLNDRRDLANHTGVPYLRKRLLRRVITSLGGFFHLPEYGLGITPGATIGSGLLSEIQVRARAQVLQESDVRTAAIDVSQSTEDPSLVIITIRATTLDGTVETVSVTADLSQA